MPASEQKTHDLWKFAPACEEGPPEGWWNGKPNVAGDGDVSFTMAHAWGGEEDAPLD